MSALTEGFKDAISQGKAAVRNAPATSRRFLKDPRSIVAGASLGPLVVLYAHALLDNIDRAGFNVILPEVEDTYGLTVGEITAVGALALLVSLGLGVPAAYLSDRGRRRTWWLASGALLAAAFSLGTGVAPSVAIFVAARAGFGLGIRLNDPVQSSLLSDYYAIDTRPTTFAGKQLMESLGAFAGPLFFGIVAEIFGWRAAIIAVAPPALLLTIYSMRLHEPGRGAPERAAMGVTGDDLDAEEEAPRFREAVRICNAVPTLRRVFFAVPFLVGGILGISILIPIFLDDVFGMGPAERGFFTAIGNIAAIAGLFLGVPVAKRYLVSGRPEGMVNLLYVAGTVATLSLLWVAVSPNIAVMTVGGLVFYFAASLLTPGLVTLAAMIVPPRVRGVGFALMGLWAIPGLLGLPIAGVIGEEYGLRWGMIAGLPLLFVGGVIIGRGARTLRADIEAVFASAMAAIEARQARAEGRNRLLVCKGVDVAYGQVQVLFDVDFEVAEGEMVALLGTNGAGKSTLLKAICGLTPASSGTILFDGRDITRSGPVDTASLGVVQVPGGKGVFPTLTVAENLRVATWLYRKEPAYVEERLEQVLGMFPILRARFDQPAGNLSGGEQQMLTLGQAFIARPKLLLIDELSLGLAPTIVQQLLDMVRAIHDAGVTVVLVEQSVNVALTVCDRAVFLEKGEVRFEGPTGDLLDRPDVLRSVFLEGAGGAGSSTPAVARRADATDAGYEVLAANGIVKRFGGITAVDGVSLSVHQGEILGLIGSNGAGKTTIFDLLSGFLHPDEGMIVLDGVDVTNWTPDERSRARLGRSFQDARLFPSLTVEQTIAVALERHLTVRDPVSSALFLPVADDAERAIRARVDELIDLMNLGAFRDKFISELSTGSRRIVDLACTLAHEPKVLLLDEPSSGIAQRETEALGPLLLKVQRETGTSLLVIEHDMPLIRSISDRLIALETGAQIAAGSPDEVLHDPKVIASYLGTDASVIARSGTSTNGNGTTDTRRTNGRRRTRPLVAGGRTG